MKKDRFPALRLNGVKELWLQNYWDIYRFQYDTELGIIWPVYQVSFKDLKKAIHEDQIDYEVVWIRVENDKALVEE